MHFLTIEFFRHVCFTQSLKSDLIVVKKMSKNFQKCIDHKLGGVGIIYASNCHKLGVSVITDSE